MNFFLAGSFITSGFFYALHHWNTQPRLSREDILVKFIDPIYDRTQILASMGKDEDEGFFSSLFRAKYRAMTIQEFREVDPKATAEAMKHLPAFFVKYAPYVYMHSKPLFSTDDLLWAKGLGDFEKDHVYAEMEEQASGGWGWLIRPTLRQVETVFPGFAFPLHVLQSMEGMEGANFGGYFLWEFDIDIPNNPREDICMQGA